MKRTTYQALQDKTPKYTIKQIADLAALPVSTVRYYDNAGLLPSVTRTEKNVRMFSDHSGSWLRLIHALRTTGLPIERVRHYIALCRAGDSTIDERAAIIYAQEDALRRQMRELKRQMEVLEYKKSYYRNLQSKGGADTCNPQTNAAPSRS